MERKRCVIVLAALVMGSLTQAGEPSSRVSRSKQREAIEAILAQPLDWAPEADKVTIQAFIDHVREKHSLAIRWDGMSFLMLQNGGESLFSGVSRPGGAQVTDWTPTPPLSPYVATYTTDIPENLKQHVTNFGPEKLSAAPPNPATVPPPVPLSPDYLPDGSPSPTAPTSAFALPPGTLPSSITPPGGVLPQPIAPPPGSPSTAVQPAPASEESDDDELPHLVLASMPLHVSTVSLGNATVREGLEQLLQAASFPMGGMADDLGLPFVTRAFTLDYVIDGSSILLTTQLRANALKETRVYRVAHLKSMPAETIARTICHSVRPWSWRSQTSEIADRLAARWPKGGLPIPQMSISNVMTPAPVVQAGNVSPAASTQTASTPSGELSPAVVAGLGQLLTGGAVAAVESAVNAIEIAHHGDPPTGVMEVLPGVLVITQSQGAHREIAELLDELAAATAAP